MILSGLPQNEKEMICVGGNRCEGCYNNKRSKRTQFKKY